jgi:hypothetical protein
MGLQKYPILKGQSTQDTHERSQLVNNSETCEWRSIYRIQPKNRQKKPMFQTQNDEACRGSRLLAKAFRAGCSGRTNRAACTAIVVVGHGAHAVSDAVCEALQADAGAIDAAFIGTARDTAFAAVVDVGFEYVAGFFASGLPVRTGHFVFAAAGKHEQCESKHEGGEHFHSTKNLIRNLPLR